MIIQATRMACWLALVLLVAGMLGGCTTPVGEVAKCDGAIVYRNSFTNGVETMLYETTVYGPENTYRVKGIYACVGGRLVWDTDKEAEWLR